MRLALAACLALIAGPVAAEPVGKCLDRNMALSFFKHERGLSLHSWGLDDAGNNLELMLGADGRFAVLVQKPNGCASVLTPNQFWARISDPQFSDKPVPDPAPCMPGLPPSACQRPIQMDRGTPL